MNRKELKEKAKRNLSGINALKIFICLIITSISFSFEFVKNSVYIDLLFYNFKQNFKHIEFINIIEINLNSFFSSIPPIVYTIFGMLSILLWIITPVLDLSLNQISLKLVREGKIKMRIFIKNLANLNLVFKALILKIILMIYIFLWSLLLIIPGIIKAYSYSMAFYIMADSPEISALDALEESRRLMRGHKFDLFILQLSFFWWQVLSWITFGIAYIYVGPYMKITKANFYEYLKEKDNFVSVSSEKISNA